MLQLVQEFKLTRHIPLYTRPSDIILSVVPGYTSFICVQRPSSRASAISSPISGRAPRTLSFRFGDLNGNAGKMRWIGSLFSTSDLIEASKVPCHAGVSLDAGEYDRRIRMIF